LSRRPQRGWQDDALPVAGGCRRSDAGQVHLDTGSRSGISAGSQVGGDLTVLAEALSPTVCEA
jgi:hypothetical protein